MRPKYVTRYFDSTHQADGKTFCNPLIDTPGPVDFDQAEAKYAYERILVPLNVHVAKAANTHKWRLVSGSQQRWAKRRYCSGDKWIVGLVESLDNQGNQNGALHANVEGNRQQAALVVPKLRVDFYGAAELGRRSPRNGSVRAPRRAWLPSAPASEPRG